MCSSAASAEDAVSTSKVSAHAASHTTRFASSSSTNRIFTLIVQPRKLLARCETAQLRPPPAYDRDKPLAARRRSRRVRQERRRLLTSCAQAISIAQRSPTWAPVRNTVLLLTPARLRKGARNAARKERVAGISKFLGHGFQTAAR